jgi:CRISPR-associated protein Cmr3
MARGKKTAKAATVQLSRPLDGARTLFLLEPMDAWFFRDGRPFDATDPAQMPLSSLFPPMPQTAIGAVRAALALALGWDGRTDWSGNSGIQNAAGSGDAKLGVLTGALMSLVRIKEQPQRTIEPLFAPPPLLFGELPDGDEDPSQQGALPKRIVRLGLGPPRRCDLGDAVRLPLLADTDRECKPLAGKYLLTTAGMTAFLQGGKPQPSDNHLVAISNVFESETRTGLAIDPVKRTAVPGMLYRISHARPCSGLRISAAVPRRSRATAAAGGFRIGIAVNTATPPGKVAAAFPMPVPFGGEGRMAWISLYSPPPGLPSAGKPAPDRKTRSIRYSVILATPADLGDSWPGPGASLPGLPGRICSACIDKASPVSGWIGFGAEHRPRDSRAMIPAGATWFLEVPANDRDGNAIAKAHGAAIGGRTEWGYGRILIGTWNEQGG